ncbi:HD-GYP domain-containing protein [Polynucleobacter sp. AP-Reno-20A-A9]|uniref:HD-GYP domain-containing protein n=1 Tax=Polynucleobacter sp. AP-Reno-20A-A9 TaxID=2576925 RepID=UPI001C0B151D|nr:HD domain-containing phosphohydrolase [Polynucleobacter sp. AP-Reno-20A-A9]MBU3628875.1 HD domain-containing protein [Polynucleobacter sp. AP-Reno-20A-A9]
MSSFFWGKGDQKDQYRVFYWPFALGLLATSSLAFFIAPWVGKWLLIVGNFTLLAGTICISLLFSKWNNSLTLAKKTLASILFVGVFCAYLYLVAYGQTQQRIHLLNTALALVSLWQLSTLLRIMRTEDAYQIKLLIAVELFQLCARVLRSVVLILHPDPTLVSLYQEDMLGFSLRISSFLSNTVVCILISNYYIEKLMQVQQKSAHAIERGMLQSLNALSMVRDNETGNHILRTKKYLRSIASKLREMGVYKDDLSAEAIDAMAKAAPLHDIGKVGIPDHILKKNGPLTQEEWVIMKTHTSLGEQVLEAAKVEDAKHTDILDAAIEIAGGHHENWDGSGYPRGLAGLAIPLSARIMSLADMYDALVSERVYKNRWSHEDACTEILRLSGTRFDPAVVEAFMLERNHFLEIANTYQDAEA